MQVVKWYICIFNIFLGTSLYIIPVWTKSHSKACMAMSEILPTDYKYVYIFTEDRFHLAMT